MVEMDKALLQAVVDNNGIAWINYPGPPYILWQLVEVDSSGNLTKHSSAPPKDQMFDPVFRARSAHWKLAVQFCGDGVTPGMTLEVMGEVACAGINALASRFPGFFED